MLKGKILRELYWLAAIAFVAIVYREFLLPAILGNSALDINLHDTYYIGGSPNTLWIIIPGSCFIVYLTRAILSRFKNSLISVILIFFTLFIIIWLGNSLQLYSFLYHAAAMSSASAVDSAKDTAPIKGLFYGGDSSVFTYDYYVTAILQTILVLLIAFAGYTIGRNKKSTPEANDV